MKIKIILHDERVFRYDNDKDYIEIYYQKRFLGQYTIIEFYEEYIKNDPETFYYPTTIIEFFPAYDHFPDYTTFQQKQIKKILTYND